LQRTALLELSRHGGSMVDEHRQYPEPKQRELSDEERKRIRRDIVTGDCYSYALAKKYRCSTSQIAGIKSDLTKKGLALDACREQTFLEGEKRAVLSTVRSAKLRAEAKNKWGLKCYCCGFEFAQFYGNMAQGCGVVHHLELLRANSQRRRATVEDVRVVYANCHYVLHLKKTPMGVDDLKKTVSRSWHRWAETGIKTKK
jgi:predicted HNH restriction endonuclease